MVKLGERKTATENKAIERLPSPAKAYIPLTQHLGKACVPLVGVGDAVLLGQKIAAVEAHVYAPIHASISGKVTAIQEWPHPVLGSAKAIVIDGDGLDKTQSARTAITQNAIEKLTPQQIRNIVFEAGIVGMGGASFPTHIKLNPPKPVDTLIINGAECEPYLTGDYRLMVEETGEILKGIALVVKCLGAKSVYIAIEDNKPEAVKAFEALCDKHYTVRVLKSMYPQGGEKQLIKNVLGKEVPRGKLPFDVGVVVHNVATVFAVYDAVYNNKPLYERVLTVTGSPLSNPQNLLVRIGTPIRDLINFCGPLKDDIAKIIIGGPMMGIAQFTDQAPVIKSTTGIILFDAQEARIPDEEFCIRCGACVRECPVNLMPCLINLASQKGMWTQAKEYGAMDCIECGLCNYICPANRRLVHSIKRAKMELAR
jgi:electron transport complex protein RnfC